jgi:RNA polymerase sigma-70 factor, ECF subfamily
VTAAVAHLVTIDDPAAVVAPLDREPADIRALVDAARDGSRDAFGDLVTRYESVVLRTARAALGAHEDAEDVAQEAFVVAWRKLPGFRGDATFRTWLLTIVWRKALDRRRWRQLWQTRTRAARGDDEADPVDALASRAPDPERTTMSRDMVRRVRSEIRRLSPRLRDTLLLATSGEHAYEEIAAILGVPLGTVKWRVAEARRIVRRRLEETT